MEENEKIKELEAKLDEINKKLDCISNELYKKSLVILFIGILIIIAYVGNGIIKRVEKNKDYIEDVKQGVEDINEGIRDVYSQNKKIIETTESMRFRIKFNEYCDGKKRN